VVEAFVLIQTEIGSPLQVASRIRDLPRVATAVVVTGPYDVIAHLTADDIDSLAKAVVSDIQAVDGVTRTLTCPVVRL
jgi:DNA-binding Lrp family transcriptional regulator